MKINVKNKKTNYLKLIFKLYYIKIYYNMNYTLINSFYDYDMNYNLINSFFDYNSVKPFIEHLDSIIILLFLAMIFTYQNNKINQLSFDLKNIKKEYKKFQSESASLKNNMKNSNMYKNKIDKKVGDIYKLYEEIFSSQLYIENDISELKKATKIKKYF